MSWTDRSSLGPLDRLFDRLHLDDRARERLADGDLAGAEPRRVAILLGQPHALDERLRRWRLLLGEPAEEPLEATLGEICDLFRSELGEYRDPAYL